MQKLRASLSARRGAPACAALLTVLGGLLAIADTPLWWFGGSLLMAALVLFARASSWPKASINDFSLCVLRLSCIRWIVLAWR